MNLSAMALREWVGEDGKSVITRMYEDAQKMASPIVRWGPSEDAVEPSNACISITVFADGTGHIAHTRGHITNKYTFRILEPSTDPSITFGVDRIVG